jgi:hypothetical protein
MRLSTELVGVLVVIITLLAIRFLPVESSTTRLLMGALVITVGGGIIAFLRSRRATRR